MREFGSWSESKSSILESTRRGIQVKLPLPFLQFISFVLILYPSLYYTGGELLLSLHLPSGRPSSLIEPSTFPLFQPSTHGTFPSPALVPTITPVTSTTLIGFSRSGRSSLISSKSFLFRKSSEGDRGERRREILIFRFSSTYPLKQRLRELLRDLCSHHFHHGLRYVFRLLGSFFSSYFPTHVSILTDGFFSPRFQRWPPSFTPLSTTEELSGLRRGEVFMTRMISTLD